MPAEDLDAAEEGGSSSYSSDGSTEKQEGAEEIREAMSTSEEGAPSEGRAVSDIFSTDEIFHRVIVTAEDEISRSTRLLFLSGLAAGLSIGLSFLARAALTGLVPEDATGLIGNLLYPVGFIFVILGRYQLFTENTFTPVTLVLTRHTSLPRLMLIWGLVYAGNVLGAAITALLFSKTQIFDEATATAAYRLGTHAMELPWSTLFFRGVIAGWMVAGMVWLIHAVRDSLARFFIVYFIMYMVPSVELFHCIIGACEIAYLILEGGTTLWEGLSHFQLAVTLGNTVGGVLFVALPNYFQTGNERFKDWKRLTWREWFLGTQ